MEDTSSAGQRRTAPRTCPPDLDLRRADVLRLRRGDRPPGPSFAGPLELGYNELVSSFILGNESSMLWHWRNGFDLLPYSGSRRKFREMLKTSVTPNVSQG